MPIIDATQYCNWSRPVFEQMRAGGVDAVIATVAYHEDLPELIRNLGDWHLLLRQNADLITRAGSVADIRAAMVSGRTAILFALQTPVPMAEDLSRLQILHDLGIRVIQPSYNNQSALASGWQEPHDGGLTRFGAEAVAEMNRLGLVIDLSHTAEQSCLDIIACSTRPVVATHANPTWWRDTGRNKSDAVIRAMIAKGGMMGFSIYPHHLAGGSSCSLEDFSQMVAKCLADYGAGHFGIGSDLCQDQPDGVVDWMRRGRWTASPGGAVFPAQPDWFRSNLDFAGIAAGLTRAGLTGAEVAGVMGDNWLTFLETALAPGP